MVGFQQATERVEKAMSTAATGTKRFQSLFAGCIFMSVGFGFIFGLGAVLKRLVVNRRHPVR